MEIIKNIDNSCNCNFDYVVFHEGFVIFGAPTYNECEVYVSNYNTGELV